MVFFLVCYLIFFVFSWSWDVIREVDQVNEFIKEEENYSFCGRNGEW